MRRNNKAYAITYLLALVAWLMSAVMAWLEWGQDLVPPERQLNLSKLAGDLFTLPKEHLWSPFMWPREILPFFDRHGPALIDAGYPWAFAAALVPGALLFAVVMTAARGSWWAIAKVAVGCVGGASVTFILWQYWSIPSPMLAVVMPGALLVASGALTQIIPPRTPDSSVIRGTQIAELRGDSSAAIKRALREGATAFGGVVLKSLDEVSHFLAAGVTRVGKSLALRELIYTALARGDRVLVADPDGGAMKFFYKAGDVILNPYDDRSSKWDLLGEIEEESDYEHLAATLLPFSGSKEAEQWEQWAQDIFAVCLRYWHRNDVGTSDEFTAMMASASNEKLALLCEGIEAARVFKPGMEKVLGSILQTLATVIKDLRRVADGKGELFSMRQWIREGTGSLWMPYGAKQIPSLRRLISCWSSLAIADTMSLGESDTRRIWVVVDELDALGPIADLENALVRGAKFGVCVALGFQTIAQVVGTYGREVAASIVENCNNRLFLRCNQSMGGGTALFASEVIGEREIGRIETSNTQTEGQHGSSSTSENLRRQVEKAVLASEITRLPKREGYLRTESDPDWKRVRIAITKHKVVVPHFVPVRLDRGSMD